MPRHAAHVLLATALAAWAAGCGDLSGDELGRRVDTLTAIAAEGRLLARDVARDRTRSTFVRVHARTLSASATHEAEKVADATAAAGSRAAAARTVRLAERLGDALGELSTHPGDEARGARVGRELVGLQRELERLAART